MRDTEAPDGPEGAGKFCTAALGHRVQARARREAAVQGRLACPPRCLHLTTHLFDDWVTAHAVLVLAHRQRTISCALAVSVYADWLTQARKGSCQAEPQQPRSPAARLQQVNNEEGNSCVTGSCASISHVSGTPEKLSDAGECASRPGGGGLVTFCIVELSDLQCCSRVCDRFVAMQWLSAGCQRQSLQGSSRSRLSRPPLSHCRPQGQHLPRTTQSAGSESPSDSRTEVHAPSEHSLQPEEA